jgi:hypothetical protein
VQADDRAVLRRLAAAVAGAGPARPEGDPRAWIDRATRHRVHVLLADRAAAEDAREAWPEATAAHLTRILGAAVLLEAVRHEECRRVFRALRSRGVRAMLIKGGALAHTDYRQPHLRPRADTDVLIPRDDLAAVEDALAPLGYRHAVETSGALITQQCHFDRIDGSGIGHAWDVHWKIGNVHAIAGALTYEEIRRDAVALEAFDSEVEAPSAAHALLIACLHRVAHHADAPDLLWLLDIHLLAARLGADQWTALVALARERRVWAAVARSLSCTRMMFDTNLPSVVAHALDDLVDDPTVRLLDPGLRQVDVFHADLAALPTWTARWQLVREHVFPPAAFMRARYGVRHRAALPWWYARRLLTGGPGWFRRLKSRAPDGVDTR